MSDSEPTDQIPEEPGEPTIDVILQRASLPYGGLGEVVSLPKSTAVKLCKTQEARLAASMPAASRHTKPRDEDE